MYVLSPATARMEAEKDSRYKRHSSRLKQNRNPEAKQIKILEKIENPFTTGIAARLKIDQRRVTYDI